MSSSPSASLRRSTRKRGKDSTEEKETNVLPPAQRTSASSNPRRPKRKRADTRGQYVDDSAETIDSIEALASKLPHSKEVTDVAEIFRVAGKSKEGALTLLRVMRKFKVDPNVLLEARGGLVDSFSKVSFKDVAPFFNLNPEDPVSAFADMDVKRALLPRDVREGVFLNLAEAQSEVGPMGNCNNEAQKSVYISALMRKILHCFKSRILKASETKMTSLLSSRRFEYLYEVFDLVVIVLTEAKDSMNEHKNIAQVMLELDASNYMNHLRNVPVSPVRACLTTGKMWTMFAYDAANTQFYRYTTDIIVDTKPGTPLQQLAVQINELLSILYWMFLDGWVAALRVCLARSKLRGETDPLETISGSRQIVKSRRASIQNWEKALEKALVLGDQARQMAIQAWESENAVERETNASKALAILQQSVSELPMPSLCNFTDARAFV